MIRFGVIGTNWITEAFIEAARQLADFQLTAVYSRTEEKANEFAAKHGITHIFTDLEAMASSDQIDAVYIASPNSYHAAQAIMYMNHGKHVLCEKPLASNAREVQAMIKAANSNNVVLMEALKSTLLPNFISIQQHLHKIGPVRRYFASYCQYSSRYDAYKQGTILNAFNPVYSNGALMDLGIYCLYPMIGLFGKPDTVQANAVMLDSGVDGEGSILLKYEGMDAVVMYSKITNSYVPSEIQGENGSIIMNKISEPDKVEIRYRDGSVEDISQPQNNSTMFYEAEEFINLIKSGKLESVNNAHANSIAVMEVMDQARRQTGLIYPADTAMTSDS
ncbi:Gfo/Idh/MocA family protein [Paenibacillus abyssi]|uniref:Oxidoreductase YulF n=1 Tax=Paenibacillus abyssi TaxID=1340531 RepID=A0A917FVJ6_9BACL|nr:Gfo/Idh/MocA family oxidoreductase [Paenibacillus abyssi]GGG04667.1 putative oxidoreductase YulF [Paenibacillus abyssi]